MPELTHLPDRPVSSRCLTRMQVATLVVIGAVLWLLAALLLRALEPRGVFGMPGIVIFYALLIPGTIPFILLAQRLAKLAREQILLGVTIVTATASMLDGNALIWIPSLYGANTATAGASILWGVGVGLFLGIVMSRPRRH